MIYLLGAVSDLMGMKMKNRQLHCEKGRGKSRTYLKIVLITLLQYSTYPLQCQSEF